MRPTVIRRAPCGTVLADNLYLDNRGRPGHYRYRRKDGTFTNFTAASAEEANRVAIEANALRSQEFDDQSPIVTMAMTSFHAETYIQHYEANDPARAAKKQWQKADKYHIRQFARDDFPKLADVKPEAVRKWWLRLTFYQQKQRHAAFRRWFNWMMGEGLLPAFKFNLFTLSHDQARLLTKGKPERDRPNMTVDECRAIYQKAPEFGYEVLQDAIDIGLYTSFRRGDLCALRLDRDVVNDRLRWMVGKSEAMKGAYRAARFEWNLPEHPVLRAVVQRCRERALKNRACPFLLSHTPERRVKGDEAKVHLCQVLPDRLYRMFIEVRDACGIDGVVFHSVRGLASDLYLGAGYTKEQIRHLMDHESVSTTEGYMNPAELPYEPITMRIGNWLDAKKP